MGTTEVWSIRYAESFDPGDPSAISHDLADSVETALSALTIALNGPLQSGTAVSNTGDVLTTTNQDVDGATMSVTVLGTHAKAVVTGTLQISCATGALGAYCTGDLLVDGVAMAASGQIVHDLATTYQHRTASQTWTVALPAGAHTLKLAAKKNSTAGTAASWEYPGSTLTVVLLDAP
ncbi:MAG TPA: hypothetical protein VL652_34725 [Kutzneria sp.]|jgi:hypothetical protein|nr:hypothetical protein [Kutzneria sp.]